MELLNSIRDYFSGSGHTPWKLVPVLITCCVGVLVALLFWREAENNAFDRIAEINGLEAGKLRLEEKIDRLEKNISSNETENRSLKKQLDTTQRAYEKLAIDAAQQKELLEKKAEDSFELGKQQGRRETVSLKAYQSEQSDLDSRLQAERSENAALREKIKEMEAASFDESSEYRQREQTLKERENSLQLEIDRLKSKLTERQQSANDLTAETQSDNVTACAPSGEPRTVGQGDYVDHCESGTTIVVGRIYSVGPNPYAKLIVNGNENKLSLGKKLDLSSECYVSLLRFERTEKRNTAPVLRFGCG
ncbi:MAG: hypothetical protein KDJ87_17195 [Rhizobiaceae bacterium]|nr:hypothetical protein [Rhizobiaceae bacterium]